MNIEELSKAQLLLLTILVNFVMSVATAILTVSLLDHAPAFVTQTVNRVVERTIETVTAAAPTSIMQAPAPSNQDLVTAAIGAAASRVVAIYATETGTSTPAVSVGTFLPKQGVVVTAAQDLLPKNALIEFTNGTHQKALLSRQGGQLAVYSFADNATLPKIASVNLIPSTDLRLGQTVLAVSTDGSASTGIIARVSAKGIRTTLPDIGVGSAAVDLYGNLVGIATGATPGFLISASAIAPLLSATSTTATSTIPAK